MLIVANRVTDNCTELCGVFVFFSFWWHGVKLRIKNDFVGGLMGGSTAAHNCFIITTFCKEFPPAVMVAEDLEQRSDLFPV
jgi:hypothetical protein